ncbi:PASTA domain-containing protein, partial [Brachyspira sp. SAP_772]|uniref:PASTA domain-containing protein n=1 Tax=Brachyspira sp. SAP_772 TaxID=2608385 RepID=UPI0012F4CD54
IQSHYFKDYPLGKIVSQEPNGGMRVKRGRTVYLVVNVPEQALVKMPDLTGKSYDDAVSIISNEIISKIPSVTILPKLNDNNSAYDNNVVLSQVPNANEVIGINTEIILTVNNKTE